MLDKDTKEVGKFKQDRSLGRGNCSLIADASHASDSAAHLNRNKR